MDNWKIGHILITVELQRLDENNEVVEKQMVPSQQGQPSLVLLGAHIPEEMKKLIFSKLQQSEKSN